MAAGDLALALSNLISQEALLIFFFSLHRTGRHRLSAAHAEKDRKTERHSEVVN